MAEIDRNDVWRRLRRVPGQLLLALLNGTAVLVIVAAILVLVATARIERFAGEVASTMTDAVLSKVELPSKDVLADLAHFTEEVRALRIALGEIRDTKQPLLRSEIERLKDKVMTLNGSIDRLGKARSIFTEEVMTRSAGAITSAFVGRRSCSSTAGKGLKTILPEKT